MSVYATKRSRCLSCPVTRGDKRQDQSVLGRFRDLFRLAPDGEPKLQTGNISLDSAAIESRRRLAITLSFFDVRTGRASPRRIISVYLYVWTVFLSGCFGGLSEELKFDPSKNPAELVNRLAMIRSAVPPSRMDLTIVAQARGITETITNRYAVEFDQEKRMFESRQYLEETTDYRVFNKQNIHYSKSLLSLYDGFNVYYYDNTSSPLFNRDDNLSYDYPQCHFASMPDFDLRVIGGPVQLQRYLYTGATPGNTFQAGDDLEQWSTKYIGREQIDGINTWRIRVEFNDSERAATTDYWVGYDIEYGLRLYQCRQNGFRVLSHYDNDDYPWLPSKVVVNVSDYLRTEFRLSNAEIKINDPGFWNWRNKKLPIGTVVWSLRNNQLKFWDGSRLSDSNPKRRKSEFLNKTLNLKRRTLSNDNYLNTDVLYAIGLLLIIALHLVFFLKTRYNRFAKANHKIE